MMQASAAQTTADVAMSLAAQGAPDGGVATLAAMLAPASTYYPANLGLAGVYDYYETEAQGAARISHGGCMC